MEWLALDELEMASKAGGRGLEELKKAMLA
jgi:hypothetical protein